MLSDVNATEMQAKFVNMASSLSRTQSVSKR